MEIETKLEKKGGKSIRQRHEATNKQTSETQRKRERAGKCITNCEMKSQLQNCARNYMHI